MTTAVVVRRGTAADPLAAAGALALAAVMTLLVPLLGAVRAADGSPTWFAPGALWVTLLPAVATAVVVLWHRVAALAVAAGAGLIGVVRLLADLPVLTAPDAIARPDLFVETTDRSLPFHASGGGYLLLAADVVTVAAGIFAALRLSGRLSLRRRSDLIGPPPDIAAGGGDGATSDAWQGATGATAGIGRYPVTAVDAFAYSHTDADVDGGTDTGPSRRNNLMIAAGFLGVLLLVLAALTVPYQGGYLSGRFVSVGVPLAGLVAAVLLAVLGATAVLVAGSLPGTLAVGLLGGAALGACVPPLVAIVTAVTVPVRLSGTVWLGLAGGAVLAAAGLLTRVRVLHTTDGANDPGGPLPSRATAVLSGLAGVAAGALAVVAFALPALDANATADPLLLSDGSPVPGGTLFLAAAVPLVIAGVLALVPATARAGCAALMVVWAAAVPAVTGVLQVLGDDRISLARLLRLVSVGPGTWCGVAALALSGVAAVLAAVARHRADQASAAVADDELLAAARGRSVPVAVLVSVLTLLVAALPVYGTVGQVQGPTILRVYTVDAWGVWAQLVATVGALAGAVVTRRRWVASALCLAGAAVQVVRLVVPAGVPAMSGFALGPGFFPQIAVVLALVGAAGAMAAWAGQVKDADSASWGAALRADGASSRVAQPIGTASRAGAGRSGGGQRARPSTRPTQRKGRKRR